MKSHSPKAAHAIAALCPSCGLCCNGVLFGDVELQRGDDSKTLTRTGIDLFRKGRKTAFTQPCACLVNELCAIYQNRPKRCAEFDCRLLMHVQKGKLTAASARKKITQTKQRADVVLKLVRQLGNNDETLPLNKRYSDVISQPIDMADDETQIECRGELMIAVANLAEALERDFLT